MAKKLKTYITQIGFFELAIAAPSMKAALEAWGMTKNIFHQGFAHETDDPKIIAATVAAPGVVLRRAVGSKVQFTEHGELPDSLPATTPPIARHHRKLATPKKSPATPSRENKQREKAQILSFEKARAARDKQRAKVAAAREAEEAHENAKREKARERAEAASARARKAHEARMQKIEKARDAVERRADAERKRWDREKAKAEEMVRKTKPY